MGGGSCGRGEFLSSQLTRKQSEQHRKGPGTRHLLRPTSSDPLLQARSHHLKFSELPKQDQELGTKALRPEPCTNTSVVTETEYRRIYFLAHKCVVGEARPFDFCLWLGSELLELGQLETRDLRPKPRLGIIL